MSAHHIIHIFYHSRPDEPPAILFKVRFTPMCPAGQRIHMTSLQNTTLLFLNTMHVRE